MQPILLALLGSLTGVAAVTLLYLRWRGDIRLPALVASAWIGIAGSILMWGAAYKPDVGVPFAILVMTLTGLGLVLRGADLKTLARFPTVRSAPSERPASGSRSWSGAAARALAAVLAAPVVGMTLGLLAWVWAPGHDSNRFVWAAVCFLVSFAALQVWGLSAARPWRTLCLIALVGLTAAVPVGLGL